MRARLDADRTAQPKTRLVAHVAVGPDDGVTRTIVPGPADTHIDNDSGKRTDLREPKPTHVRGWVRYLLGPLGPTPYRNDIVRHATDPSRVGFVLSFHPPDGDSLMVDWDGGRSEAVGTQFVEVWTGCPVAGCVSGHDSRAGGSLLPHIDEAGSLIEAAP